MKESTDRLLTFSSVLNQHKQILETILFSYFPRESLSFCLSYFNNSLFYSHYFFHAESFLFASSSSLSARVYFSLQFLTQLTSWSLFPELFEQHSAEPQRTMSCNLAQRVWRDLSPFDE